MNRYERLSKKFDSGELIHKYHGYSPYYIGVYYGSAEVLGGEKKFKQCADMMAGICDVDFWIKEELDKLSIDEEKELVSILNRNYNIKLYIDTRALEVAKLIKVEPHHVYRLGSRKILDLLLLIDQMTEDNATVRYCANPVSGTPLGSLDLIEHCDLHKQVQDYIKHLAWKKYEKEQAAIEVVPSDIDYEALAVELMSVELGIEIPKDIE